MTAAGATVIELWREAEAAAARAGDGRAALVAGALRVSHAELGRRIRELAAALPLRGATAAGEVVALLAPNSIGFVTGYFAALHRGATVQPLDPRLGPAELAVHLAHSGARLALVHHTLRARLDAALGELAGRVDLLVLQDDGSAEASARAGTIQALGDGIDGAASAELMYTSGTSGRPKAVIRSHAAVRAAAGNAIRGFGYRAGDVIAIAMPLSHSSGLVSQLLPILQLGGTAVLLDGFDAPRMLQALRDERVSCLRLVPAMVRLLLALPEFSAATLPALRLIVNSSAPIDPATYLRLKERFASIAVMNSYGLTEASTCTVLPDELGRAHPDSVGRPIDGVELCVLDEQGGALGPGETGEICVRGPHLFTGYRGDIDATLRAFAGGWLHTGDLGYRDADGLYYLQGRRDDVINCGGRKVVPEEVESCILELAEVAEAAVTALPHRVLGEVVQAWVVIRAGSALEMRAVVRHCARRLPSHMAPFRVTVVDTLPRNAVGKLVRHRLRAPSTAAEPQGNTTLQRS